jgi:hypothetical protein
MVKRKCGTCRHFKDGGIAGSGWCQHPSRKDIQHMVLVRKTELACRNSWDQDLWELAEQPLELQPSQAIPVPISGGDARDIQVAQADVVPDEAARHGEMFTDRITSISMPTRSQLRPRLASTSQDEIDDTDTELQIARSSVREARKRRQEQRHLERRKHQESVLQQAGDLLERREPESPSDRDLARVRAVDGPMTSKRDRDRHVEPPAAERQPPPAPRPKAEPRRPAPVPAVEFSATPARFSGKNEPPARPPREKPPVNTNSHMQNGHQEDPELERGRTEPLPSATEVRQAVERQKMVTTPASTRPAVQESPPRRRAALEDASIDLPPAVEERPTTWYTGAGHVAPVHVHQGPPPKKVDPIDTADGLTSLRRCCATCRDFKQVGDGRTGWCTNPHAFSDRRMVQSDEIACRSSLGVWWLPHDGFWLEQADTTHHGRPTPLLDELLGTASTERQGMGQRSSR